ncbi:MAG: endolytic transglycosylase MltG [Paracoccaceae bacterium]
MWRHIASNGLTFLAVGMFLLGGIVLWGQRQYNAEGPLEQTICVRVESGSNMDAVSRDLVAQGAVSSGAIFRIGSDYADKSSLLKAGSFLVEPGASMEEVVDAITRGGASTCGTEVVYRVGVARMNVLVRELDPATNRFVERASFDPADDPVPELYTEKRADSDTRYRVALAEGVTSWQVVDSLKAMDVLSGELPEIPPEGSLAPDSYDLTANMERADVLAQMQVAQDARISQVWQSRADNLPLADTEDLLKLASIIEKETGVPEERRQVASVFVNRLNRGMRLQTDPTVIYGVTGGKGSLGRGLRQSELRKSTPWNTYVIEGLPETPIANPGLASLEAAANPDTTGFVFFVADGTGGHAFAETLGEHNANVARWRKIEAERSGN